MVNGDAVTLLDEMVAGAPIEIIDSDDDESSTHDEHYDAAFEEQFPVSMSTLKQVQKDAGPPIRMKQRKVKKKKY